MGFEPCLDRDLLPPEGTQAGELSEERAAGVGPASSARLARVKKKGKIGLRAAFFVHSVIHSWG